jgi:NAD(P)H-hydrate epimerase
VDALFGTGFSGKPRDDAARTIEELNGLGVPILSVDVPSGVDASTGQVAGAAVKADATVTFHGRKVGLVVAPGRFHAGEVEVADIGLQAGRTRHEHVSERILEVRAAGPAKQYTAACVLVVGGLTGKTARASPRRQPSGRSRDQTVCVPAS